MLKLCVILILFCCNIQAVAQKAADTSIFKYPILMDSVVVVAKRDGWDVGAFIKRVQNDTTFYKAFRALHLVSYTATNDMEVYDKEDKIKASLHSHTRQNVQNHCRTMQVLDEKTTGDFYKHNKECRYYTAELFAYLFFTKGRICNENDIVAGQLDARGKGQMEKNKAELKQLIFNPGGHINGIPFIGDKASIFDPDVAIHYNFSLLSEEYDGQDCYVFKAIPKKGEEKDLVYNELSTWFRKSDYSIVARDYSLSFSTLFYDFDVHMQVRTRQVGTRLLPTSILYNGSWHIITQKREVVKFLATFSY